MSIKLSTLVKNIGVSIQRANQAIEESVTAMYFERGFNINTENEIEGGTICTPIMHTLNIPDSVKGTEQIDVPITALFHNTSLKLESIDVKLKFRTEEIDGDVAVIVASDNNSESDAVYSELNLSFINSVPTEGVSRVNQKYLQIL